jgi:hypothetical protein
MSISRGHRRITWQWCGRAEASRHFYAPCAPAAHFHVRLQPVHRAIVTVALACVSLALSAQETPRGPKSPDEAVANAFTVGTIYTFAVMRNGSGFCLPPEDRGVDVIWKKVENNADLFKDVKFEPNRLPEDTFLKLLREWFPCR